MKVFDHCRCIAAELRLYLCNEWVNRVPFHAIRNLFYRHVMHFELAPTATIFMHCRFDAKRGLVLGARSVIHRGCRIDTRGEVTIGEDVTISEDVHLITSSHDMHSPDFEGYAEPVSIGDRVFVGPRVVLLPGVTIGIGSVIGAGAVVTRAVPEHTMAAGIPAKAISARDPSYRYQQPVYRRWLH